jgi:hypothetical protein
MQGLLFFVSEGNDVFASFRRLHARLARAIANFLDILSPVQ